MNSLSIALMGAAAVATQGEAAITWVKGTDMCGGVITDCSTNEECTTTAIASCPGTETNPTQWIETSFEGMAYVDRYKYLSCANILDCAAAKVVEPTGNGYIDIDTDKAGPAEGDKYAYVMAGSAFGDMASNGGYAGICSALNVGKTTISTKVFPVYLSLTDGAAQVSRDDSKQGAPEGPFDLCISDTTSGECNGEDRTMPPDYYKFNIFGTVTGTNYNSETVEGTNGFPKDMSHIGVRMKVTTKGFKPAAGTFTVNGAAFDESAAKTLQVESMGLTGNLGGLSYTFPQKYNYGDFDSAATTTQNVKNTKDILIRITLVPGTDNAIYVDYLFNQWHMTNGRYFIYDPTVTHVPRGTSAASTHGPTGIATITGLLVVASAFVF